MLAVVLVVQDQLDRAKAPLEQPVLGDALRPWRHRRSRPRRGRRARDRHRSPSRARRSAPAGPRHRRRAWSRTRGSSHAAARSPRRRRLRCSAAASLRTRAAIGLTSSGSSSAATSRTALVEQLDLRRERVAEEAGDAQGDVDPRAVQQVRRQDLDAGDPVRGRIPDRPRADQRQRLGDVVAAGAHVGGAPGGQRHGPRPVAVLLQIALDQQRRRLPAEMPGRRASARRGCRPRRNCARSAARPGGRGSAHRSGRARRSGRRAPPARPGSRHRRCLPAPGARSSRSRRARRGSRSSRGPACGRRSAARPSSSRRSSVSPWLRQGCALTSSRAAGRGPDQGSAIATVERIEGKLEIAGERAQQRGVAALARLARRAHQGRQQIGQLLARGRLAEHVQAVADLQLLQLAQMIVELGERVVGAVVAADADVAVQPEALAQREDLVAQPGDAARIDAGRLVILVDQALELGAAARRIRRGSAAASGGRRSPRRRAAWPGCPRPDR